MALRTSQRDELLPSGQLSPLGADNAPSVSAFSLQKTPPYSLYSRQQDPRSLSVTGDLPKCVRRVSNPRPPVCKTGALPLSYPRRTLKL